MNWNGNKKVGAGRMTIVDSIRPQAISIQLEFFRPMRATNQVQFTFSPRALAQRSAGR